MNKSIYSRFRHTILLTIGVVWIVLFFYREYDDTDDIANGVRSGFLLYTDHLTGCQYLRAGYLGGIIPRLSKGGNHVGCK